MNQPYPAPFYGPPPGFRSLDARQRLQRRAWGVGLLLAFLQVLMPIAVMIAAFATLVSACASSMTGPNPDASGAMVDQGRVWFTVNAPSADEDTQDRRLLIMSAAPGDEKGRLERDVPDHDITLLSREPRLFAAGDERWLVFEDHIANLDGVPMELPAGANRRMSRPFVLDGHPAIATVGYDKVINSFRRVDASWDAARPFEHELPDGAWVRTLTLESQSDGVHAFVLTYDDQLLHVRPHGEWKEIASEARDYAIAQSDGGLIVLYVTPGPGIDAILDDLEETDPNAPPDPNRPKAVLHAVDLDGNAIASVDAPGVNELSALSIDGSLMIATAAQKRMQLRSFSSSGFGEPTDLGEELSEDPVEDLFWMGVLWFFAANLVTLVAAAIMALGVRAHRAPEEVAVFAPIGRRALAVFIDATIIGIAVVGAVVLEAPDGWALGSAVGLAVLFWGAEAITGATPGKWLTKIRVRTITGGRPGARVIVRALLMSVDVMFGGVIGILSASFHNRWQRIGDQAAGTVVVRLHPLPTQHDAAAQF